jgi:hypothetical protein
MVLITHLVYALTEREGVGQSRQPTDTFHVIARS